MPLITLLTDFGQRDYYVAAVKGVLLARLPRATLVDISHEVAPGDVAEAAFLLAAAWRWYPRGTVHLVVVDPQVGSDRRILAAAAGGACFVAPDNGALTPILDGAEVRAVARDDLFLPGPGATFHGRDRFAPVAAFLAVGGALAALGPEAAEPVRLVAPPPVRDVGRLCGRVVHVDRFGNLVSDLPNDWLAPADLVAARVGGGAARRFATHYAALPPSEPAVLPGSLGTLELAVAGASLAALWGVGRGAGVEIDIR